MPSKGLSIFNSQVFRWIDISILHALADWCMVQCNRYMQQMSGQLGNWGAWLLTTLKNQSGGLT